MAEPSAFQGHSLRVEQALSLAAERHAGQRRKGTTIPYIVHPVAVGWLLERFRLDEDVVIAGLLHDVLEDTACTAAELQQRFGARVTDCVVAVTEPDKRVAWETRKQQMVERMRTMSRDAKAVSCADKAHNLHTIADALEAGEDGVWTRFRRGPEAQLDYHRRALQALAQGFEHGLVDELRAALGRLEAAMVAASRRG